MKKFKKLASLILAMIMVMAMAMPAFATEVESGTGEATNQVESGTSADTKGVITINNAISGQTYSIYKIFELESYDNNQRTDGAYTYKLVEDWREFFTTGYGKGYVEIDKVQNYVKWTGSEAEADVAEFAKKALEYAKNKSIAVAGSATAETTTVTFSGLGLGYYLLDSTTGALCSLNTTNNTVEIQEKNTEPTLDKEVEEDSTKDYGTYNDANIGQVVNFKTTITASKGAQNYVMHDKMSKGLTYKEVTGVTLNGNAVASEDYKVVAPGLEAGCTFEVRFSQTFCDTLGNTDVIVISYSAVLNKDAVVEGTGNENEAYLEYGDGNETEKDYTYTHTYKFELVKTKNDAALLNGAQFELYDAATEGNKIALVKEANGVYRLATEEEQEVSGFTSAVIDAGRAVIEGLDGGTTYYLEETKAPDGYNKLDGRIPVILSDEKVDEKHNGSVEITDADGKLLGSTVATVENDKYVSGGIQVINQTGSLLPSTGGIGTTIFYVIGGILVVGAGILLVTKKRMSKEV